MRKLIVPTLILATAGSASAQMAKTETSFWSLFTADRVAGAFVNQLMFYARLAADVRYDGMEVDAVGASIQFVGLEVKPKIPGLAPDACTIRADRATVHGAPFDQIDTTRARITLDNALVAGGCFPADARPMIGMLGVQDLNVDRLDLAVSYHVPSGAAQVQLQAGVDGVMRIIGDADIDYVSYRMDFNREEPEFAVLLNSARVQIEDQGAAALGMQFLPPELRDPATLGQMVQSNLTQAFTSLPGPATPAQTAFIADAAGMAQALVQGGKRVVLETNIAEGPLRLDERAVKNPSKLFDLVAPRIASTPMALDAALPLSQIVAAQDGDLTGDAALATGRALISGIGAPRNIALAVEVLAPLANDSVAEASYLLATATTDVDAAYGHALRAAAAGHAPALSLLDQIENSMTFAAVMNGQDAGLPEGTYDPQSHASIGEMRSAAIDHMIGMGAARSYKAAYFWAALAAAAGDSSAAALREELDVRMRLRGLSEEWAVETQAIEDAVLEAWTSADMPARLRAE